MTFSQYCLLIGIIYDVSSNDDGSYYGIVPSETLCENDYENYLKHADPYELEHDIISYETLLKISEEMNEDAKEKIKNIININAWNRYYKRISKK